MKWSMDTHKYMSEITREALQIIDAHKITSTSEPEEIDAVERELGKSSVYKNYESAKGRVRRALFTYFKSYGCLDEQEQLTEVGTAFIKEKLSVKEFSFHYVLNYIYEKDDVKYFPAEVVLTFLKGLQERFPEQAYLQAYDFSRLIEVQKAEDITDEFIADVVLRRAENNNINERSIGFDVWTKMFVQAGILTKDKERNYVIENFDLVDWILTAYKSNPVCVKGNLCTGILSDLPILELDAPSGDVHKFENESRAIQAFLFDSIEERIIKKYIFSGDRNDYEKMKKALGLSDLNKGFYSNFIGLEHLVAYSLIKNEDERIKAIGQIIASVNISCNEPITEFNGKNIMFYGVPGAGKSHAIDDKIGDCKYERVVFHPDYTYSDFVGQIMPKLKTGETGEEKLSYEFVAGPFTKALDAAINNPNEMFYLVIEEINRGNAPAIFGDVFQLLDRNEDGSGKYHITNFDIAREVYGDETEVIKLPSNLSIYATMNTSDQNVFTLDTAFQRRWHMKYVRNDISRAEHAKDYIDHSGITWEQFAITINREIVEYNAAISSSEDKQLGAYFVKKNELNADVFPEKALKYLWDDAFKLDREQVFDADIKSIGDLIGKYHLAIEKHEDPLKYVMRGEVYKCMSEEILTTSEGNEKETAVEEN